MVDESKCLDTPILEFSIILEHLTFWPGYRQITALAACPVHPGNLDFCCRHLWCWWTLFCKYCVRPRIIFHNVASEYNSACVLLMLCLQFGILPMTDVHQRGKMNFNAFRPCFIDHLWFVSDFCYVPRRSLFKFLPFFIHCCFCCGYLHGLRHGNKFVYQIIMLQWIVPFSCNMVLMVIW